MPTEWAVAVAAKSISLCTLAPPASLRMPPTTVGRHLIQ